MSVSKWRYTEACDGMPCPGDCDHCSFDPEEPLTGLGREIPKEELHTVSIDEIKGDAHIIMPRHYGESQKEKTMCEWRNKRGDTGE